MEKDKKHIELYEYAQKRMQDLYNWLKDKYNVEISYAVSWESYMKLSDLTNTEIKFKDLKAKNNSITLHTYNCDNKDTEYFLSLWYYTGGDNGHHDLKRDIKLDLVQDDDFFFEYVNDYIEDFFKLKPKSYKVVEKKNPKKETYVQTTIFDFI